jgi:Leucine-rich repeat (LRR) protein
MLNKQILKCLIILIRINIYLSVNICQSSECVCDQEVNANYITCIFHNNVSSFLVKNKNREEFNITLYSFKNVDTFKVIINNSDTNPIPKRLFQDLNINYLLLNENGINKLDFEIFNGILSVTNLYLSSNNLSEMIEFYNFSPNLTSTIESLVLKNNSIKRISSHSLNYLTNLNHLDLSYNNIDIDIDADNDLNLNLKTLNSLDLSYNKIKSVDFRYFSNDLKINLERLNLNSNALEYLINLNDLKNLRYLSLSSNKLNELYLIPITKLVHLIKLDLSKNFFKQVHRNMLGHMKNLTKLDFSYNYISVLDGFIFKNFKNLEKLYLQHNELKQIDLNWFKSCGMLNVIDISNNQIDTIKNFDNNMAHLNNLKIIRLSNNKLKSLSFHPIHAFPNLKMLYLDSNYIEEFSHQIDLKNLIKFDLSNQHGKLKNLRKLLFKTTSINNGNSLKFNLSLNENIDFHNKTFCTENHQESNSFYLDLIISNQTLANTNKCILKQLSFTFKRTRLFIINEQNSEQSSKYSINETICSCDFRLFLASFNILLRDICPLYVTYCFNEEFKDECTGKNEFKCDE